MSTDAAAAVPPGHRMALPAATATCSILVFAAAAMTSFGNGYSAKPGDGLPTLPQPGLIEAGGAGLNALIVLALRQFPVSAFTILAGATALGALAAILRRRGWAAAESALFCIFLALNPLVLFGASTGQIALLTAATFGAVVLCAERLERIGDVQSQMTMGLVLALVVLISRDAIYFILPVLTLLPLLYREIRSLGSALAAYMLVTLPSLMVFATVAYIETSLQRQPLARLWGVDADIGDMDWAARYGGDFLGSAGALITLAAILMPAAAVPAWHLISSRGGRARPGTSLTVLVVPLGAGVLASGFWHAHSGSTFLFALLGGIAVWIATCELQPRLRRAVLLMLAAAVISGWSLNAAWIEMEMRAWRASLAGPIVERGYWRLRALPVDAFDWRAGFTDAEHHVVRITTATGSAAVHGD